jgi:hypothetical protein
MIMYVLIPYRRFVGVLEYVPNFAGFLSPRVVKKLSLTTGIFQVLLAHSPYPPPPPPPNPTPGNPFISPHNPYSKSL